MQTQVMHYGCSGYGTQTQLEFLKYVHFSCVSNALIHYSHFITDDSIVHLRR